MRANVVEVVLGHAERQPGKPCLRFFRDAAWRDWSWGEMGERVRAFAGGLQAVGIRPGDRVAIVSENRPEWALADIGSQAAGAVVVSVYASLPPADVVYHLRHSGSRLAFVEDAAQAERVLAVRGDAPQLERLVVLFGPAPDGAIPLADLEAMSTASSRERALAAGLAATRATPVAIVYTSGTTGVPKGAVLTHGNVLGVVEAVLEANGDRLGLGLNLSFLPLAHALERIAGHFLPLLQGWTIAYARGLDTLAEDFRAVRPDFAVAVPRVFEKIHAAVHARVAAQPAHRRALFSWASRVGQEWSRLVERGQPVPAGLALRRRLADLLVLRRLRAAMGGRVKLLTCGGAPLSADVARFFHGAGLLICEGWGATETSAPATANTPRAFRFGTVGRPLPGVEVRVADDGELEVRGANVFAGYHDDPAATAEALVGGWYRTGDIGRVEDDGFVSITDRKKELIITSGGKNIAPQKLENALRQRPLVSNAMVWGDGKPYVVALLTVDGQALAARRPDLADAAVDDPRLRDLVGAEVEEVNRSLARFEQVKAFRLVEPDFSTSGGELTVTLKLRRRVIAERHRDVIDGMYSEPIGAR